MGSRSSKWFRGIVQGAMASALVVVGLVSFSTVASGNAADPNPTTTGTITANPGGTVTANLSGTWSWPGQDCSSRYGTGWAVDWWGVSTSKTPSPNFSLTNATEVNPPGTTTTGTVAPFGTVNLSGNRYFHVGQYYAGETINSATTCSQTGSGGSVVSSGSWSASATYPSVADVPTQLCVNMYDEHGSEGSISNSANDFSPSANGDNSIQTNTFDPTAGKGYCVPGIVANIPTTTATQVSPGTVALGPNGTLSDSVTVTGTTGGGQPTGSVAFYVCGPSTTTGVCASTATTDGTATLPTAGNTGFVSTGTSGTFTPKQVGTYCFAAVYTPATGSDYAGSTDNQSTFDSHECATVTAASSTTATTASPSSLTLGPNGTVTDSVTVTGTPNAGLPTGTVAFYVCGPSGANALCASTATPEGTASLPHTTPPDTGDVSTGTSSPFMPTQTGTYCFAAVFTPATGSNYNGSTDNQTVTLDPNECFTANSAPNVSVLKSASPASGSTVIPGQTIAYTLSVANSGTETSGTETVADAIPAGTTYVSGSASCGTVPNCMASYSSGTNTVTFTLSSVAGLSSGLALHLSVTVNPNAPGPITNVALRTDAGCPAANPCPSNPTTHNVALFGVVKSSFPASGTTVVPGQNIGYTLTASNPGSGATGTETVSDVIPANSTYIPGSASCGTVPNCTASYSNGTNTVTFTLTSVAAGASGLALTFNVTVNANATTTIDNVATITGPGCTTGCPTNHTDNPVAAFSVVKSSNPASGSTVVPGQVIGYTLTAANAGNAATGQEVVSDPIPPNTTYIAGSASCGTVPNCTAAYNSGTTTVTFTLTSVGAGATGLALTFNVTVNANATTTVDNVATITGPGCTTPPCSTNHTDNPVANFGVVKSSNPASGSTVIPGQVIGYTLTAANAGNAATGTEVVSDLVPAGTTYVTGSASCGTVPNCTVAYNSGTNTVTYTLTSVAAGATGLALTFNAQVNANATTTIDNVATITGPGCTTGCPTNHTDNPVVAFGVVKSSNPASGTTVVPGQTIGYTLTASNTGNGATGTETVNDLIPANTTYVTGSASCGTVPNCTAAYSSTTKTVTFTLTSVAAMTGGLALTFNVTVNANATTTVDNVATITGAGCTTPCPTNHTDNPVAAFGVVKSSNPASGSTVVPGQVIGYTLTASNPGSGATGQEVVSDLVPANTTYVPSSASCGTVPNCNASYSSTTKTVTFTLTSVAAGATGLALTFNVTVNANATTTVDNVATITGPGCTTPPCSTNHTDNPVAAFAVVKTSFPASGTTVVPGQQIGYTLTASNAGNAATGTEIVGDAIPANTTYVPGTASCGTVPNCAVAYSSVTNTVTFTLTSVAAGATGLALTLNVTVSANATTTVDNVATITGPGCTTPCSTNHTDNPVAAFGVVKSANPASGTTVSPGQTITYTLTASNPGSGATGQETVTDVVPANSTYVPSSASCGTVPNCTASYNSTTNTVTFTLTSVAANTTGLALTFKVTANNTPTGTTIVNTAIVTGAGCTTGCPTNMTTNTVLNPPVLTVAKTGCAATAVPGETYTYTIAYANTGTGDSPSTILTDILPPSSQASVSNTDGGTQTTVGGLPAVVWNLGTVLHQTSGSKFVQFVVTGSSGSITNTATISSPTAAVTTSTTSTVTTPISTAGAITHGDAYAVKVTVLGIPLVNQLGNAATVAPGSPQAAGNQVVPTIGLPGVVLASLIDDASQSSVTTSAESTALSRIVGVNLLNGGITADAIRAESHSVASVGDDTYDSIGSSFVNLKINGVALSAVPPNTTVDVKIGALTVAKVVLYQDTGTVTHAGSLTTVTDTVNMINITLLSPLGGLPAGASIIIGHASTDATFPSQNAACGVTPGAVSGEAYTAAAEATVLNSPVASATVGDALLPITGGLVTNGVNGTFIPFLAASGTATDSTIGSLTPTPNSASDSRIQGLSALGGLITADAVDASCVSAAGGGVAGTVLGTTFVNLRIGGVLINANVTPNSYIAVPYNGSVVDLVLNEQATSGNGTTDTAGTVDALHLYVLNGSGLVTLEAVIASAHCDAHTGQ